MRLVEQQTEIAFDSLPVPYLEEWDRVKIIHEDFTSAFTLTKFSIPLTVGDVMTVGYNRRLLTIKRTNIKTKKTKRVTSSTSMKAKRKK